MGVFNPTDSSINLKIVYYGPAFGGKTTNLSQVQGLLDPAGEQEVLSVNTGRDTTLFFDYLPLRFLLLKRYVVRVQGFTVPGQVQFDTTRRLVLKGADGVVFVADSTAGRLDDNVASLENLRDNLVRIGASPGRTPLVIQYNKRDLPGCLDLAELERVLNPHGLAAFPATAVENLGVYETFREALRQVLTAAHAEYQLDRLGLEADGMVAAMDAALEQARSAARAAPGLRRVTVTDPGADRERLLESALEAGVELAELAGSLAEERNVLAARHAGLLEAVQRIVHDLRKPLVALGNAHYMLDRNRSAPPPATALDMALEVVQYMGRQLEECAALLKEHESPSAGEYLVDLRQVAEDVLRRLSYYAAEHGVVLVLSGELPRVRGNPEGLTSLLSNLVGNAIKYHAPDRARRRVEVVGRPLRAGFLLAVRDNGIGVPACDRRAVFSKYHRAGNATSIAGSGLGLHIAREIARAHDGRLGLRSTPGRGSLFWLWLPAGRLSPSAEAAAGSPASSAPRAPEPSAWCPERR